MKKHTAETLRTRRQINFRNLCVLGVSAVNIYTEPSTAFHYSDKKTVGSVTMWKQFKEPLTGIWRRK